MMDKVRETIKEYDMLSPGEPVLCALSGGADSTALLCALLALGYPVRAYHLNHCLRGAEADRDEAFCRALCGRLGVPLAAERIDVQAEAQARGEGIETAARQLRYERLEAMAQGIKIATAHTADDNIETMLFHLARGTGLKGLAGIPPVRGAVIRPLIGVERSEIEAYLAEIGQDFVTDSTNHSDGYTRNHLRHRVVPALREVNPALAAAAARLCRQIRQDDGYLTDEARRVEKRARSGDDKWDVAALLGAHPAIRSRAFRLIASQSGMPMRDFSTVHVAALERLLETDDPSAAFDLPHGFTARREYGLLCVERTDLPAERPAVPLTVPFSGDIWDGQIKVSVRALEKNEVFYKSFNTFCVDCGTISLETLCIRTRQPGDRIRLTLSGGSRTLKKLMIDRKIPRQRRGELAVVADEYGVVAVQDVGMDSSRAPQGGALVEIKIEG